MSLHKGMKTPSLIRKHLLTKVKERKILPKPQGRITWSEKILMFVLFILLLSSWRQTFVSHLPVTL